MKKNQLSKTTIDQKVMISQLSVEYWRADVEPLLKQYFERYPNDNLITLGEKLGDMSAEFAGVRGYFKLQNVQQKRASLRVTALAVQLLQTLLTPASAQTTFP